MKENEKQVSATHYGFDRYINKNRWFSYYSQILEVLNSKAENVLIIGVGDGLVPLCIEKLGIKVKTFDFDIELNPDYVGDIINIKNILGNIQFDCILCCQVLEHIPYNHFNDILNSLETISKIVILSLPYRHKTLLGFSLKLPKFKNTSKVITIPCFWRKLEFNGEHYWEIGVSGYSLRKVIQDIKNYFKIERTYLVKENTYHRFFILKANDLYKGINEQ